MIDRIIELWYWRENCLFVIVVGSDSILDSLVDIDSDYELIVRLSLLVSFLILGIDEFDDSFSEGLDENSVNFICLEFEVVKFVEC